MTADLFQDNSEKRSAVVLYGIGCKLFVVDENRL